MWKTVNLVVSAVICVLGVVTILQVGVLIWKKRTPENVAKFRRLMIRFGVLVGLALVLNVVSWLIRYAYFLGVFSGS